MSLIFLICQHNIFCQLNKRKSVIHVKEFFLKSHKQLYFLGISLGGSDGGASILDLHSGALSFGEKFINIYSLEEAKKIFNAADLTVYKVVKSKIQHAVAEIFHIDYDSLYLTHPTFFSRLTNLEPRTEHDEYWHVHVDKVSKMSHLYFESF